MPHKDLEKRREYFREYHAKNKAKKNAYAREYYAKNPEKMKEQRRAYHANNQASIKAYRENNKDKARVRDAVRWRRLQIEKYGLNPADFPEVLACEVCGSSEGRVAFDHDHGTGVFRGILCTRCNVALGMARDNPLLLENLARYLRDKS